MADTTDNLLQLESEFILTDEGRTLILSQEGGVKLALYGFMIAQGLNAESLSDYRSLTMEKLLNDSTYSDVTFILKNLDYNVDAAGVLSPDVQDDYISAMNNLKTHLFPLYYIPTNELKVVNDTNTDIQYKYGTYQFNFDPTSVKCNFSNIKSNLHFNTLVLIGKQYSSTNDATYNIDERQNYSVVGVVRIGSTYDTSTKQVVEGGIEILKDQNKYLTFQTQLRMCIKESENVLDDSYKVTIDEEILNSGATKYIHLINNGLKNIEGGIGVGQDKEALDELNLGDGSVGFSKSLMVADSCDATEAENQFNAVGNIHSINKTGTDEDGNEIETRPQYLLSTVKVGNVEEMPMYTAAIELYGERTTNGVTESPIFDINLKPNNTDIAVELFGIDNSYVESNDKTIFSTGNTFNATAGASTLFNSNNNSIENVSSKSNTLYNSDGNKLVNAISNILFGSNNNTLNTNKYDTLYSSNNIELTSSMYNILFGCSDITTSNGANYNHVYSSDNVTFSFSCANNILYNANHILFNSGSSGSTYNSINNTDLGYYLANNVNIPAALYTLNASSYNYLNYNMKLELSSSNRNYLIKNSYVTLKGSSQNTIFGTESTTMYDSSNNISIDDGHSTYTNATNNYFVKNEHASVYDGEEYSDSSYTGLSNVAFKPSCSNNTIIDTYGTTYQDVKDTFINHTFESTLVRVKGSKIIDSDFVNLYNAKKAFIYNSNHTYINVDMPTSQAAASDPYKRIGLNGLTSAIHAESNYLKYKSSTELLDTNYSTISQMSLNAGFFNTYGSSIDTTKYNYKDSNSNKFNDYDFGIRTDNSNIIGGNHNLLVGGQNVQFIGAEYCQNNRAGKSNQIILGRLNNAGIKGLIHSTNNMAYDADIIYGNGWLPEQVTVNNITYNRDMLRYLDTTKDTIEQVRKQAALMNALEFSAPNGRLTLRETKGYNVTSNKAIHSKSVDISPTGIKFYNEAGALTNSIGTTPVAEKQFSTIITFSSLNSEETKEFTIDNWTITLSHGTISSWGDTITCIITNSELDNDDKSSSYHAKIINQWNLLSGTDFHVTSYNLSSSIRHEFYIYPYPENTTYSTKREEYHIQADCGTFNNDWIKLYIRPIVNDDDAEPSSNSCSIKIYGTYYTD